MNRLAVAQELVKVARLVAANAEDVVREYPIRDDRWHLSPSGVLAADASDLRDVFTDPWRRPIPRGNMHAVRDNDNDIMYWQGWTTVAGKRVDLTIIND